MKYKMNPKDFKTISLIVMNAIQEYMKEVNIFEDTVHMKQKKSKIIRDIKQEFNRQINFIFKEYELQLVDRCLLMKSLCENGVQIISSNN